MGSARSIVFKRHFSHIFLASSSFPSIKNLLICSKKACPSDCNPSCSSLFLISSSLISALSCSLNASPYIASPIGSSSSTPNSCLPTRGRGKIRRPDLRRIVRFSTIK
ncbi:hypothetical protein EON65_02145 [archaeon]|nr:MAG: hypothetical protein EON65_02145 [archaeon]